MFKLLSKISLALIFWGVFIYVILNLPYPQTITQASVPQLLSFFVTLLLAISFTLNIFLNFIFLSFIVALGMIFLLVLKALDSLNIITAILTLVAVGLLFSYFRKAKRKGGLTSLVRIPKLTHIRK